MPILNSIAAWIIKKRIHQIELFKKYPLEVQNEWFNRLIYDAKNTEWGKKYDYKSIKNYQDYKSRVPISDYVDLKPYVDRLKIGEQNILWSSDIKFFAKSSGTTNAKSKFIPVSSETLEECHYKGGKDMLALYFEHHENSQIFSGRSLMMGGSKQINQLNADSYSGDLSAILMHNMPFWAQFFRTPDLNVALMEKWEEKIEKMTEITIRENITNIAGVPSWTLVLFQKILEKTGAKHMHEIWPNLELFMHGGVSFLPYEQQFKQLIPGRNMHYLETYNASEGFFGIEDELGTKQLLLMLDYGIYFEFILPEHAEDKFAPTIALEDVELNKNYALVISTNSGLWRYLIGDTIRFTKKFPFRFKVSGRTKHYINAFGEELIVENADAAIKTACEKTESLVADYTVAPVFMTGNDSGCHEWLIEFEKEPDNLDYFIEILDNALKALNSDYEAKRYHNYVLKLPVVHNMPKNTFYNWLKHNNKLGGQNKVPRLANNRHYVEEIKNFAGIF